MSGWTRRRSSGEIINATLLEVFLALSFMVFALAVFQKRRADAAENKIAESDIVTPGWVAVRRNELDSLRAGFAARADSLAVARKTIDSLNFASPYPPDCEPGALPAELFTVTLTEPGKLAVATNRSRFGLSVGETMMLSPNDFRVRFDAVRAFSVANGCRFLVRIVDTPGMTKSGYKEAMAAVTSIFRFRGAFR